MTMDDADSSGFATSRTAARLAGFFGVLALLIASVGLYAVVAMSVSERTREMGLHLALGATPRGIVKHLMTSGARLGTIGLVIGLIGAFAVARTMAGLLFGMSPSDPITFIGVPLVLALVVMAATWLPSRRAAQLQPMSALRATDASRERSRESSPAPPPSRKRLRNALCGAKFCSRPASAVATPASRRLVRECFALSYARGAWKLLTRRHSGLLVGRDLQVIATYYTSRQAFWHHDPVVRESRKEHLRNAFAKAAQVLSG